MGKIKIHEIAKKLGVNSKDVLEKAQELGLDVKTHMSSVDESEAKKIEAKFSNNNTKKEVKEKRDNPVIIRREVIMTDSDATKKEEIKKEIINMPNYFADYDTIVNFVSDKELRENHNTMPHGGFVIRSGKTGKNNDSNEIIEYSLKLDSNPEFTASVLVAYARAVYKLYQKGEYGAITIFDIPPALLSTKTQEELLKDIL